MTSVLGTVVMDVQKALRVHIDREDALALIAQIANALVREENKKLSLTVIRHDTDTIAIVSVDGVV